MKANQNEQDFVFRYFQSGKLDTKKALLKVKARLTAVSGVQAGVSCDAPKARLVRMSRRWIAIAATLLVLVAVGAYTLLLPQTVTFTSGSEVMACHLPDGTQVTLSPHSSLSYQKNDCRKVEMKGCAYFRVKHDETHSFDVRGERGHVMVLGTQFLVDERIIGTSQVMVTSGKVFFSARDSREGVFLMKGQQARLASGKGKPQMLGGYDVNDVAWATHQLHFDNTPLSEVLQRLSENNPGVELTASDMHKRLTGDFTTDSISQAIQIIEQTLDVSISVTKKSIKSENK